MFLMAARAGPLGPGAWESGTRHRSPAYSADSCRRRCGADLPLEAASDARDVVARERAPCRFTDEINGHNEGRHPKCFNPCSQFADHYNRQSVTKTQFAFASTFRHEQTRFSFFL